MNAVSHQIPSLKDQSLSSALYGTLAALCAASLDTYQARDAVPSVSELSMVFVQAIGRLALLGALLTVVVTLTVNVVRSWAVRRLPDAEEGRHRTIGALGFTLLLSPGGVFVAYRLFQGGLTSRLPARDLLMVAAALILLGIVFGVGRSVLSLTSWADRRRRFSAPVVVASLTFFVISVTAHYVDGHFYRRLYLYLHGVLGLITMGGLAVGIRLLFQWGIRRPAPLKPTLAALLSSIVVLGWALWSFNARQTVKVAVFENTSTVANVLQLLSQKTSSSRRGKPSDKIIALRKEREAKARFASQGDFEVFPGAHVLFISVDALRADRVGVLGNRNRDLTPTLDKWVSRDAVNFERAYCSAPHSSFSITGMHISRYPHDEARLNREIDYPTMAEVLEANGYETVGLYTQGIFFTEGEKVAHYRRSKYGIDKVIGGAPPPDILTDKAIAEIDRAVLGGEPPTFFWVHYFNVHEPYVPTTYGTSPADRYDGEVAAMDPEAVRLIRHAETVLTKGVVVVFTADHGEEFKDHGGYYHGSTLYDEQVRVPLFFRVPNGRPQTIATPVTNISIAPTVLRLVGVAPPPSMIGPDLRPAIFGGDDSHVEEPVFAAVVNQHMVVRWPWKYIADPAVQRFQLFNLEKDPLEKFNIYDGHHKLAEELQEEIDGFLDEMGKGDHEGRTVLNLGHMRDPRALPGLIALLSNTGAPDADREEAAELLGQIRDDSAIPVLEKMLNDESDSVALSSALSLANLNNMKGADLLYEALFDPDPAVRDKVALALGARGDKAATEQLVEALGRDEVSIRERAIKMLGIVGDPAAVGPLIDALAELRSRYLTVHTLGRIRDPRAFEPLMKVLAEDKRTDVRGYTVVGLGYLGDKQAIPALLEVLAMEPEIKWTPESLVRLGAVGTPPLFGTDAAKRAPALRNGWGRCRERDPMALHQFLDQTSCATVGPRADVAFEAAVEDSAVVIIRARHQLGKKVKTASMSVALNGETIGEATLLPDFEETRLDVDASLFKASPELNHISLKLAKNGTFEVDHILVLAK